MRFRPAILLSAGLVALAVAGCASTAQTQAGGGNPSAATSSPTDGGTHSGPSIGSTASSPPPSSALATRAAATCPTTLDITPLNAPNRQAVPDQLDLAFVLRCKILSTSGRPTTLVAERSTSSADRLLTALREPSQPRQDVVCPMLVIRMPYFALVESDGTVFVPKIPTNNCGAPQGGVLVALNAMQFTQISSQPLR